MKAMKAMKGSKTVVKSIPKGAIAAALAEEHELKKGVCSKIIDSLAALAASEVKKTGKFVIPGVAMLKTRVKPATKAGKREVFGKEVMVKAKPAKTVVKAYPVAAIKKSI
jgi:nucleoid DNA-binding protein